MMDCKNKSNLSPRSKLLTKQTTKFGSMQAFQCPWMPRLSFRTWMNDSSSSVEGRLCDYLSFRMIQALWEMNFNQNLLLQKFYEHDTQTLSGSGENKQDCCCWRWPCGLNWILTLGALFCHDKSPMAMAHYNFNVRTFSEALPTLKNIWLQRKIRYNSFYIKSCIKWHYLQQP